jgi:hypothetical protein
LGFFDSSILRFFDFCLDDGQEIEGGGRTDPTSILRFFDFSIYVWTGTDSAQWCATTRYFCHQSPSSSKIKQRSDVRMLFSFPKLCGSLSTMKNSLGKIDTDAPLKS